MYNNKVDDETPSKTRAEKTKSITGGGGGKTTTALFSGLSFMITSMPSSRVVNEMRASITENGGCLLDNIPKFNSSKRAGAQANRCPPDDEQQQRKKERNREVLVRASDWCEVMFGPMDPKILGKEQNHRK